MTSSYWLILPVLLIAAVSFTLGLQFRNRLTWEALALARNAQANTERLLKSLTETTDNLEKTTADLESQNQLVEKLLAEKCAAWSVPP